MWRRKKSGSGEKEQETKNRAESKDGEEAQAVFFQAKDGIRDFCLYRGLGWCGQDVARMWPAEHL